VVNRTRELEQPSRRSILEGSSKNHSITITDFNRQTTGRSRDQPIKGKLRGRLRSEKEEEKKTHPGGKEVLKHTSDRDRIARNREPVPLLHNLTNTSLSKAIGDIKRMRSRHKERGKGRTKSKGNDPINKGKGELIATGSATSKNEAMGDKQKHAPKHEAKANLSRQNSVISKNTPQKRGDGRKQIQ